MCICISTTTSATFTASSASLQSSSPQNSASSQLPASCRDLLFPLKKGDLIQTSFGSGPWCMLYPPNSGKVILGLIHKQIDESWTNSQAREPWPEAWHFARLRTFAAIKCSCGVTELILWCFPDSCCSFPWCHGLIVATQIWQPLSDLSHSRAGIKVHDQKIQ